MSFFMSFGSSFRPQRPPIAFWIPGYDTTYSAEQWYESSWSSIQLNLDEGTVLAFICRCSSEWPIIPFRTSSEENDSQLGRSSHSHQEGSTEATGPLSPTEEDPTACDVGYFVFCGLVGSKDRPKKVQSCPQDWYRTQLKGLQVMLLPGVNLSISHLLPSDWDILPGIPSAMLTPTDAVLDVAAIVKVGKTRITANEHCQPSCRALPLCVGHSTPNAMCSFHR